MPDANNFEMTALKSSMRAEALARRRSQADRLSADAAAMQVLAGTWLAAADTVGVYVAMRNEIDPAPLAGALMNRQIALALPVAERRGAAMAFRVWTLGDLLVPGIFKTFVPPPDHETVRPSVIIVPLLAFDRTGARLGYGGGYYDRTLKALRESGPLYAIGLAHAVQEVETVPVNEHDQILDAIATEREFITIRERTA